MFVQDLIGAQHCCASACPGVCFTQREPGAAPLVSKGCGFRASWDAQTDRREIENESTQPTHESEQSSKSGSRRSPGVRRRRGKFSRATAAPRKEPQLPGHDNEKIASDRRRSSCLRSRSPAPRAAERKSP